MGSDSHLRTPAHAGRNTATKAIFVWALVLAACIGVLVYIVTKPAPTPPDVPKPPAPPVARPSNHATTIQLAVFFDEEVVPAIEETDLANREAATRCIESLEDMFARHRKGIPAFTGDMTSLGTRFGVLRRMPSDWWNDRNDVRDFITDKFETHIFSANSLEQDINSAPLAFR